MQEPLEIAFHGIEHSAALEAEIRERADKLSKLYDRMTHCRVSVEGLHKQHRTGNIYEVHIDMLVPGGELVVSREPNRAKERYANPDVYTAVRDAFRSAERQLIEYKRQQGGEVKLEAPLLQAQVAELHPEEDYGYLLTGSGALLYFHRNSLMSGLTLEALSRGDVLHYQPADGESGPTAVKVYNGPANPML
jgi:ribosome-associated translation inhibitor RaiA